LGASGEEERRRSERRRRRRSEEEEEGEFGSNKIKKRNARQIPPPAHINFHMHASSP